MLGPKYMMMLGLITSALVAVACGTIAVSKSTSPETAPAETKLPAGTKSIVVAGGCFWCLDSMFSQLKGVLDVESSYVGGDHAGVSYAEVCSGDTGHAEAVKIFYDPNVISESVLLHIFFASHNPTTLNRQGPDSGTQYRSAIFYSNPEEKALAERIRTEIEHKKLWPDPIVTTIEPIKNYTRAEEYHQHYYQKYLDASPMERLRMNAGYCAAVVQPHVIEFKRQYAKYLKN
jgi:peptide-methionine (S)-S-oxide reductase